MRLLEGRVVVATGTERGIVRAHAPAFAAEGARVVVNDNGVGPAREAVDEIIAAGGEAASEHSTGVRNLDLVRELNPALQTLDSWLTRHKSRSHSTEFPSKFPN
jgi:NAD(P)-dependent dehydrogenase (short-subunit alcohol dehydrogenase family)